MTDHIWRGKSVEELTADEMLSALRQSLDRVWELERENYELRNRLCGPAIAPLCAPFVW